MRVPFYDLKRLNASIDAQLTPAIAAVVGDAAFIRGARVKAFEEAFAATHGLSATATCGSGTDALALALRALGIGPGDEVIVPAMTFVATAEAVAHCGARPVIVDVDEDTLLLTQETVERGASPRTKAVIPVHLYGTMVEPLAMEEWRRKGWYVIEDAAQAHLGSRDGNGVGVVGNAGCFSFFPGKNLGAFGDAGAVASNDESLIDQVRLLADHGRRSKYEHETLGYCSRLDGLQAAVLDVKLKHLRGWTAARRQVARWYLEEFGELEGEAKVVRFYPGSVHHLFVVRVRNRFAVSEYLVDKGIGVGMHYPIPLTRQPALSEFTRQSCPQAENAADTVLSLPMDPLLSRDDVGLVSGYLKEAIQATA